MKEKKEEKVTLTYRVLENGNFQFSGPPLGVELWEAWMKKQSIEQHNTLLETQALALEGMKNIDNESVTDGLSETMDAWVGGQIQGHNEALQQAADHLRAQEITGDKSC